MKSSKVVNLVLLGSLAAAAGCSSDQDAQQMYGNQYGSTGTYYGRTSRGLRGGSSTTAPRSTATRGGFGGLGRFFGALS